MKTILTEKGWSDTTLLDRKEAVERGETVGRFSFPGRSFTFDLGKWD